MRGDRLALPVRRRTSSADRGLYVLDPRFKIPQWVVDRRRPSTPCTSSSIASSPRTTSRTRQFEARKRNDAAGDADVHARLSRSAHASRPTCASICAPRSRTRHRSRRRGRDDDRRGAAAIATTGSSRARSRVDRGHQARHRVRASIRSACTRGSTTSRRPSSCKPRRERDDEPRHREPRRRQDHDAVRCDGRRRRSSCRHRCRRRSLRTWRRPSTRRSSSRATAKTRCSPRSIARRSRCACADARTGTSPTIASRTSPASRSTSRAGCGGRTTGSTPASSFHAHDDTSTYEVHDARDNKLATGTAAFTDQGGFDFKFDIPANANLGGATIESSHDRHQALLASHRGPGVPHARVSGRASTTTCSRRASRR